MPKLNIHAFLKNVTTKPGVYQMYDANAKVIYIGKAKNLQNRLKSYFVKNPGSTKVVRLVEQIHDINVTITPSELDALLLEISLIKKHKPKYNVQFKDGKGYPYIVIDAGHEFPSMFASRYQSNKANQVKYGPYPNHKSAYAVLDHLYSIFKIRNCKDSYFALRQRPCLRHQINRCLAPCVYKEVKPAYDEQLAMLKKVLKGEYTDILESVKAKMQQASKNMEYEAAARYRDLIKYLQDTIKKSVVSKSFGNYDVITKAEKYDFTVVHLLQIRAGEIQKSQSFFLSQTEVANGDVIVDFITRYYLDLPKNLCPKEFLLEEPIEDWSLVETIFAYKQISTPKLSVPKQGEKLELIQIGVNSAKEALKHKVNASSMYKEGLEQIQTKLKLVKPIFWLDCIDVSHFGGENTLAAVVVLNLEGPQKQMYRHYKVPNIQNNDYLAMATVLERRLKNKVKEHKALPDLIVIDGGKGQLSTVNKMLQRINMDIPVLAIAKGKDRKVGWERFYYGENATEITFEENTSAINVLTKIRDEAHNFAIHKTRAAQRKKMTVSVLENIKGIGLEKRKMLLEHFGGIQGLKSAKIEQITKVPGLGKKLAQTIIDALQHNYEN